MLTSILIEILIGLFCGVGGVAIKTYIPAANPLQKSLLKVLDSIPVANEAIVDLAEELGETNAKKFLVKKLKAST